MCRLDSQPGAKLQPLYRQLTQLLMPWKETKSMVFYNDGGDLKAANRLLTAKDLDGAMPQSQQNLEKCKATTGAKPVTLARAHYNLGIMQFIKSDMMLHWKA
jgi:hypothetical protein